MTRIKNDGMIDKRFRTREFTALCVCDKCDTMMKISCESYPHLMEVVTVYLEHIHDKTHHVRVEKYCGDMLMVEGDK